MIIDGTYKRISKILSQLIHHACLVFHHRMDIAVQSYRRIFMSENLGKRLHIHAALDSSGCECVSEGMDTHLFKSCRFQSAVKGTAKIAAFIGCANVRTEHKSCR